MEKKLYDLSQKLKHNLMECMKSLSYTVLIFLAQVVYILSAYILLTANPENETLRSQLAHNINFMSVIIIVLMVLAVGVFVVYSVIDISNYKKK